MPGPGGRRRPIPRGRSNLKSKRLIYMTSADIFRYIEANPYTCVQVVTYQIKEPTFNENAIGEFTGNFKKPEEPHMQAVERYVQFWNCDGFEDGERRRM